jgi:Tol biopolymer transport system component
MSCSERYWKCRFARAILAIGGMLSCGVTATAAGPVRRLTTDGTLKLAPVFTSDGHEVAFATHEVPNLVSIVRLNLADGSRRRQHPSIVNHQFDPAYSSDGRFHAYARGSTAPQLVLIIQDIQEKKDSVFQPRESRATARNPSFAPDGSRVAFSLSDIGGHQIATVNSLGKDLKHLTQSSGMNAWPVYSPDGCKIAFGSSRSGDFEIYVMNADGSDVRALTRSPGLDARPAWSPDGTRIAFTSNRDGNYEIYVIDADGSHARNVTSHPARDDYAAWHPDGRRLLFVSDRDGRSDLYLSSLPEAALKRGP